MIQELEGLEGLEGLEITEVCWWGGYSGANAPMHSTPGIILPGEGYLCDAGFFGGVGVWKSPGNGGDPKLVRRATEQEKALLALPLREEMERRGAVEAARIEAIYEKAAKDCEEHTHRFLASHGPEIRAIMADLNRSCPFDNSLWIHHRLIELAKENGYWEAYRTWFGVHPSARESSSPRQTNEAYRMCAAIEKAM